MTDVHLVFMTDQFNCSQPQPHYINDCCYGDDLADWLAEKLRSRGYRVEKPGQEDWGWYLYAWSAAAAYFVAIGVTPGDENCPSFAGAVKATNRSRHRNLGEWRIIVQKRRTLWQKLMGMNRIASNDDFVQAIRQILASELGVQIGASDRALP
ncbi:MAG TPA: hypothetical protein VHD36_05575 [Pirellulales bacterium]|nr:hypothetical protein [Pirellulales bacterium]